MENQLRNIKKLQLASDFSSYSIGIYHKKGICFNKPWYLSLPCVKFRRK